MRPPLPGFLLPLLTLPAAVAAIGCGGDHAPVLDPLRDRVAYVNQAITIEVRATDPDDDAMTFKFASNVKDILKSTEWKTGPANAELLWTPNVSNVGSDNTFDFTVTDSTGKSDTKSITVEVRASESMAPVFRQPLGKGATLDLSGDKSRCLELRVQVEDSDSEQVEVTQSLKGAELKKGSVPLNWTWNWCPEPKAVEGKTQEALTLTARDDQDNEVNKSFQVFIVKEQQAGCPGQAPAIKTAHQATLTTDDDVEVRATITDDKGIGKESMVTLYYALQPPSNPPDLQTEMTSVPMRSEQGDTWTASIPSPVAGKGAGEKATIYYLLLVRDNDDAKGDCDHYAQDPPKGTAPFETVVTSGGGGGGGGGGGDDLCEPCTSDAQCGGDADYCIPIGGEWFCGMSCDEGCPEGTYCLEQPIQTFDGEQATQCFPYSGQCGEAPTECTDDDFEDNDTFQQADEKEALAPGTYELSSCYWGGDNADIDIFRIDVPSQQGVSVSIEGGTTTDLDLGIISFDGEGWEYLETGISAGAGSSEWVEVCLPPDEYPYYIGVLPYEATDHNTYTLSYEVSADVCRCEDDAYEPDNEEPRVLTGLEAGGYKVSSNALCYNDWDLFQVTLAAGDTLHVSVEFEDDGPLDDLDVALLGADGTVLESSVSTDSNEYLEWTAPNAGDYFVGVVGGYVGSSNVYGICISLFYGDCTVY